MMTYERTCDELTQRIVALGPCILELTDAWQLFKVSGFECRDLQPSMAQADGALAKAQSILKAGRNGVST
jgi:hypothetical protein